MSEADDAASLRALFDAFSASDREAWLAELTDDIRIVSPLIGALRDGEEFTGAAGAQELWTLLFEAFREATVDIDAVYAVDGRYVLVGTLRVTGRASGATAERAIAMLCRRDGSRWSEVIASASLADGLAELGLASDAELPPAISA